YFQNLIFGGLSNEITINNTPKINKNISQTLFSVLIKLPYLSHFLFLNNSYSFSLIKGTEKLEKIIRIENRYTSFCITKT
ncbi:hypothetical protein, partial [Streptococcus pneumoniae]|uniref:hypothetical protein n=1 Tax=Streptococcus pneumoniae TaxID=1313 RepID=UPI001D0C1478